MTKIKLLVSLKIPDTTALTAFNTIKGMGYDITDLKRLDYYEFTILKDADDFTKKISDVDVLVNANKHSATIVKEGEDIKDDYLNILVMDEGGHDKKLFSLLRERMGFIHLNELKKGVLWKLKVDSPKTAEKITKEFLINPHYQDYFLL